MHKYNKYQVPFIFGTSKKNIMFSKERMSKADSHRSNAQRNMMRVMKKN